MNWCEYKLANGKNESMLQEFYVKWVLLSFARRPRNRFYQSWESLRLELNLWIPGTLFSLPRILHICKYFIFMIRIWRRINRSWITIIAAIIIGTSNFSNLSDDIFVNLNDNFCICAVDLSILMMLYWLRYQK